MNKFYYLFTIVNFIFAGCSTKSNATLYEKYKNSVQKERFVKAHW